jgi:hypothetical protein
LDLHQGKLVRYKKGNDGQLVGRVCGVVQTEFFNLVILEILEMHGSITGFYPFSHFLVIENQLTDL